jgi:hypothetical protein
MRRYAYALMASLALMFGAVTSASAGCYGGDCDVGYRSGPSYYGGGYDRDGDGSGYYGRGYYDDGPRGHTVYYERGPEYFAGYYERPLYRGGYYDDGYRSAGYSSCGDGYGCGGSRYYSSGCGDDCGYTRYSSCGDGYGCGGSRYYSGCGGGYACGGTRYYSGCGGGYGYGCGYRRYYSSCGYGYGCGGYGYGIVRVGGGWSQTLPALASGYGYGGYGGYGWGGGCHTAYIPYGWNWVRTSSC